MLRTFVPFALLLAALPAVAQDPVKPLLKKLDSKKSAVRFDALMKLAELGPKAAPATDRLVGYLTRFDEQERVSAVLILGNIGKPALAPLEKLLTHEDELTRHDAVWALALIGKDAKPSVPALVRLLRDDPDEDVRCKAAYALTRIDPTDAKTLAALVQLMRDDKTPAPLHLAIVEELRDWGEPAIKPLCEALRGDFMHIGVHQSLAHLLDKHQTKSAADAMAPFVVTAYVQADLANPFGPGAPMLSELCDSEGMSYVLKREGAKLLPAVEAKLKSKNADERRRAITVLGMMGRTLIAHADKVPPPVTLMSISGPYVVFPADHGPALVERIVKDLLPMLKHADPQTRMLAAVFMPWTKAGEAALQTATFDEDAAVRRAAFWTGPQIEAGWHETLRNRLPKAKGMEQIRVAAPLATILHEKPAQDILFEYLSHKDPALRHAAAHILGTNQSIAMTHPDKLKKLLLPVLAESLKSDDPLKRRQAAEGMATCVYIIEDHVTVLLAALKDKDPEVCRNVLAALRSQCSEDRKNIKEIVAAVKPFLKDADPNTAIFAIQCTSHSGKAGLPTLLKMLDEEKDVSVRQTIIGYLPQHDDPRVFGVLLKCAENADEWEIATRGLIHVDERKSVPKLFEILAKKDAAVGRTLKDLGKPPETLDGVALALVPLLKHDQARVNGDAAHTLEQFAKLMWNPDMKTWPMPVQKAVGQRLAKLKPMLQAKDVAVRREALKTLAQFQSMQRSLKPQFHRAEKSLELELQGEHDTNRNALDALLGVARRDADLTIRRAARKAMIEPVLPMPAW